MEREYKYVLTRVCLRSGILNLPGSMLGVFPNEGSTNVIDSETGEELELSFEGPRKVAGLAEYMRERKLDVNDEIHIKELDNGQFKLRSLKHTRKPDYRDPQVLGALLDELAEQATPLSEAEIRSFYDGMPDEVDLNTALEQDGRFIFKEGRWGLPEPEPELVTEDVAPTSSVEQPSTQQPQAEQAPQEPQESQSQVVSYAKVEAFPTDTGLNSAAEPTDLSEQRYVKDILRSVGFEVEGLSAGQIRLRADLGRSQYTVFMQLLHEDKQLDWDALMSRRRETSSTYAAVIGEHRDLLRLSAPAGMARTTLWAWQGFWRLEALQAALPLSPYDLESHFQRDGLFDHGLERLERAVAKRVAERGAFSSVLSQLARRKAPLLFMLDEVVDDTTTREEALKVLGLLEQAPFDLISKVTSGEYCLRYSVPESLEQLSDYALSLRARLPNRKRVGLSSSSVETLHSDTPELGKRTKNDSDVKATDAANIDA